MQVRDASAAAAAAEPLAQVERVALFAKARDKIGGVENAAVLAAPAYGDQRHLAADQVAKGAAPLTRIPIAGAQLMPILH